MTRKQICQFIDELTNEIELIGEAIKAGHPEMIELANKKLAEREYLYQYLENN